MPDLRPNEEEAEIDLGGQITDENGKLCPSLSGQTMYFVAKDLRTKKLFPFLLRNKGHLLRYIKHLLLLYKQREKNLKILRLDSDFISEEIYEYLMESKITPLPCIPYEHFTLGDIDRSNRSLKESIMKALYNKPHLSLKFWGLALLDIAHKMDIIPSRSYIQHTPYEL